MSLLDFDFMRRAPLAAVVVGMVAPAIGVFLVQRRLALLGDGMGHVALTGVGLAFLTGSAPVPTALVVVVAGAIGIEVLRIRSRSAGDVILALVFYGGIAGGVLLTYLAGNRAASSLNQYLFGAITTVSSQDPSGWWGLVGSAGDPRRVRPRDVRGLVRPRGRPHAGHPHRLHRRHDHHPGRGGGCHRNANGRIAAGQRSDDRADRRSPAGDPQLPRDSRGRDPRGSVQRSRRCHHELLLGRPPAPPSC